MATILKDLLGESANQILDNLGDVSDKFIALEKIIPAVNDALTSQASELRKLNKELGGGSKTVAKFRYEIANLSKTIGTSIRDFAELAEATNAYHQGIVNTTASTLKFIKAVGVMPNSLGEMSAKFTILGHTSEETFNNMYENILSVRGAYGLTSEQIDDIINATTKYAIATQASDNQIIQATLSLSKFTSQLTKAGMSSERVSDIINSMIDPDRLTDNLVLMSKLGITVNDMISGDPTTKLEGATEKMKALGQEIADIAKSNRLQANEVAKVYGLTLEEATTLANLDTNEKTLNTQKKLDQYRSEMTTFTDSIKAFTNSIGAKISKPLSFLGNIIQTFTDTINILPRGFVSLIGAVAVKKLFNWISDRLADAALKFGNKLTEPMREYLSKTGDRFAGKQKDAANMSPKSAAADKLNYGFGLNYKLEAEKRREKLVNTNKKPEELKPGEMLEYFQASSKEINDLKKKRAEMADDSREAAIFDQTFGSRIDEFNKSIEGLIENLGKAQAWGKDSGTAGDLFKEDWGKLDKENKSMLIGQFKESFSSETGIDATNLGIDKIDSDKVAEMAKMSDGPKKFMESLLEFWRVSNDPSAAENIKNLKTEMAKYDDKVIESVNATGNFTNAVKQANEVLNSSKKGIGAKIRLQSFGKGLITDVGTLFKKILSPKKLLAGLGIGSAMSILSKIGASLMKSEGIQEQLAAVGEQVSSWINGISEAIGPLVKNALEFIGTLFNLIKPKIESLTKFIGKISTSVGNKLGEVTKNISNSVTTIEDSYKKEDLRTMIGATGEYSAREDNIKILGVLEEISSRVKKTNDSIAEGNSADAANFAFGNNT